ncbi:MAG: hypothetical protein CK548_09715 [Opitutia bacterium]|nr:MAG: hypothetical protein CK548_09715 [Opitutae bacterium]
MSRHRGVTGSEVSFSASSFPLEIGAQSAELTEVVSVYFGPPGAGLFEAGLEDVSAADFDQAGADGQVVR